MAFLMMCQIHTYALINTTNIMFVKPSPAIQQQYRVIWEIFIRNQGNKAQENITKNDSKLDNY